MLKQLLGCYLEALGQLLGHMLLLEAGLQEMLYQWLHVGSGVWVRPVLMLAFSTTVATQHD